MPLTTVFGLLALLLTDSVAQDRNAEAVATMKALEAELLRTAPTTCDRIEFPHLTVYFEKTLMAPEAERRFGERLDQGFAAVETLLRLRFDPKGRGLSKPNVYLTDRAGISRANSTLIILRASRVIPGISIAYHEMTHLLVAHNPAAPRNRDDLSPEEDARVTANSGVWLVEGFADYVSFEIAARFGIVPSDLFDEGKTPTEVDAHARAWLNDARGQAVVPFIGSHGLPDNLLADREHVAPPSTSSATPL